jgi:hypothetical protein
MIMNNQLSHPELRRCPPETAYFRNRDEVL